MVAGAAGVVAVAAIGAGTLGPTVFGTTPPSFVVESVRITQGLDIDIADGQYLTVDLIAGKDTLLRSQVHVYSLYGRTVKVSCQISSPVVGTAPSVIKGMAYEVSPFVLKGSPVPDYDTLQADCWVPGYELFPVGTWSAQMTVSVGALASVTIPLGVREFKASGDVRLLVFPMVWPDSTVGTAEWHPWVYCGGIPTDKLATDCPPRNPTPIYTPWTPEMSATALNTLYELDRIWPIRSGAGLLDLSGGSPHTATTPGLRYEVNPVYSSCPTPVALPEAFGLRSLQCEARGLAVIAMERENVLLAEADKADGGHRDRLDRSIVMTATAPYSTGGQCVPGKNWAGAEIDTTVDGPSTIVVAQELSHCLGEVSSASPHLNPKNWMHSLNWSIPTPLFLPAVDIINRQDVALANSVLFPYFDLDEKASNTFMEGWDYNHLRQTLLLPRPDPSTGTYKLSDSTGTGGTLLAYTGANELAAPASDVAPRFVLVGTLDSTDAFRLQYAGRETLPLEVTAPDPAGPYALVFIDSSGAELGRLPIASPHVELHAGSGLADVSLVATIPAGAARAELRRGDAVLYSQPFDGAAPTISAATATAAANGSYVDLSWAASTSSGRSLTYAVYLQDSSGAAGQLLAADISGSSLRLPTDFMAAQNAARFVIRASDGYNIADASTNAVSIPARAPIVSVRPPASAGGDLSAGTPVTLAGVGYDSTDGPLDGASLTWTSDRDGVLGSGATLTTMLSAGRHTLTLTARNRAGLSSTAAVTVEIQQAAHPKPIYVAANTSGLSVSADPVQLDTCPNAGTASIHVTAPAGMSWQAMSDSPWLRLSGGGTGSGDVAVSVDCSHLATGDRTVGQALIVGTGAPIPVAAAWVALGRAPEGGLLGLVPWWSLAGLAALLAFAAAAFVTGVLRPPLLRTIRR
jgi:hypothetical protein